MVTKGFLMQTISKEKIEELRVIFKRDFGKDLDEATVKSIASWFVGHFKLIIEIEREKNETLTK